jgi:site-specific DNA-methyltransferase (adenine-specific)
MKGVQIMNNNELPSKIICGDCLHILEEISSSTVDMAYLDPPFFTNKSHSLITRDRNNKFSFPDVWTSFEQYANFMKLRIKQLHRVIKDTGSIFVHCDTNANFLLRTILNDVFGQEQFRSEIIWTYKRWSNSVKGLLPAHQTIFFYSKTDNYKFNRIYCPYSETTNIDQILQLRTRDEQGVSKYATDDNGNILFGGEKKGVPLSDVWEIPFLNPKAKERTGYPTQKPILLLERIIEISTNPDDLIIDPFCGSGTTLVAAKLLGRRSIGIDCSQEAVALSENRVHTPIKTNSIVLKEGRDSYINENKAALLLLSGLDILPVQRNAGIDAFLKIKLKNPITPTLIPIKVQREDETINDAAIKLLRAARSKKAIKAILIRTKKEKTLLSELTLPSLIELIDSTTLVVDEIVSKLSTEEKGNDKHANNKSTYFFKSSD